MRNWYQFETSQGRVTIYALTRVFAKVAFETVYPDESSRIVDEGLEMYPPTVPSISRFFGGPDA